MARPYFTLEEANQLLPWLREQLSLIAHSQERITELEQEMAHLSRRRQRNGSSNLGAVMHEKQEEHRHLSGGLQAVVNTIERRGILVRDVARGLVDFPSRLGDGRVVHLCWTKDEETVRYWHPTDTGYAGRQPL
jgi:hypothetical protein